MQLFPHISHIMNRYKSKIPRDDLKRFAKDIAKKLVNSDFKSGRVTDPTKIDEKHQKKVKKFCKDFFDKAALKHKKHEEEKAVRRAKASGSKIPATSSAPTPVSQSPEHYSIDASPEAEVKKEEDTDGEDVKMSEDEYEDDVATTAKATNGDSLSKLKRKRSGDDMDVKHEGDEDVTQSPTKKFSLDSDMQLQSPPPPPPPPAPPTETPPEFATPADSPDVEVTDLHADTNFKSKSMADVLAEAQLDEGDGEDMEMEMALDREREAEMDPDSSIHDANSRSMRALEAANGD
jgi:[histone H3]-lysine36 N-trimethyltransferase